MIFSFPSWQEYSLKFLVRFSMLTFPPICPYSCVKSLPSESVSFKCFQPALSPSWHRFFSAYVAPNTIPLHKNWERPCLEWIWPGPCKEKNLILFTPSLNKPSLADGNTTFQFQASYFNFQVVNKCARTTVLHKQSVLQHVCHVVVLLLFWNSVCICVCLCICIYVCVFVRCC